jgi:PAS domain S-box-containing protein
MGGQAKQILSGYAIINKLFVAPSIFSHCARRRERRDLLIPKVLLVDDTPANLLAIETILGGVGVETIKASSGTEALKAALTGGVALILLDVQMPGMDGYEVATLLRSSARTREIPIIFVTATHASEQNVFQGYESGAVDYLPKPINQAILKSKVRVFSELFLLKEQDKQRTARQQQEKYEEDMRSLLLNENAKMKAILDNLLVGITLAEAPSGKAIYMNRRLAEIIGKPFRDGESAEQYAQRNGGEVTETSYRADKEYALLRALRGEVIHEEEAVYQFHDGSRKILRVSACPIRDGRSDITSAVVAVLDVTETVIAREQLQQSYKMSALGEMAGGIAHEINNPLAIIVGKIRQLRESIEEDRLDSARAISFATAIDETAQRIVKIVNGLRTISRKAEQDPFIATPIKTIIEGTIALCSARFKYQSVDLIVDAVPQSLTAECRSTEVSQVLLNLLSNAFDAVESLPEKWVKLAVRDDGAAIELAVSDSGPGVPANIRTKILEPFFTTKPVGKGTGLGLSLSKSLMEAHGGSLTLDETSSVTRFVVRLPKAARTK